MINLISLPDSEFISQPYRSKCPGTICNPGFMTYAQIKAVIIFLVSNNLIPDKKRICKTIVWFKTRLIKISGVTSEIEISKKELTEEKSDEVCEKCNSPMIIKTGRFGKFLACSNNTESKQAQLPQMHP